MRLNRRTLLDILICLLITLIGFYSYFSGSIGVFKDQDLTFHLNRFIGLAKAFEEGQILPKIYPYANNGFGYASPLFYCDIFLYPFALLNHFGLGAAYCYKLCVLFYSFLSNLFIYFILKKEFNKRFISYIGIILYFFNTYHLYNLFIRNALGEILGMTFIPLVIYAIYKVLIKHEDCFIFLGVSFSLLIMAHLITTLLYGLFFLCMIVVFIILNRKDKKLIINTIKTIIKGSIVGLLLSCWYLMPMFEQLHSQTFWLNINAKYNNIGAGTYSILEVFSLLFNDSTPIVGALFILPGLSGLFIKNKYIKIITVYCLILFLIILGILPGTYLNIIQFYFRLYVVIFPLFCIVIIYLINSITDDKKKCIVCGALIVYSLVNVIYANSIALNKAPVYLKDNSSQYDINHCYEDTLDYNHDELGGAEYLPYTEFVNYDEDSLAIKYFDDKGALIDYIYDYDRFFTSISFKCNNDSDLELVLPLSYYKGYSGYELIDGKYQKIDLSYSEKYRELLIDSSSGEHSYLVKYEGTLIQKATLIVSCLSFVGLVFYAYKRKNVVLYND